MWWDAGDCKVLQNIDHYPPDQRHYHQGAAVHNGPSYPECGQIVPALLTTILSTPLLGIIKHTLPTHYRSCHWSSCHTSLIRPRSDFYWQIVIDGVACAEWHTFQPVYNLLKEWIFVTISFIQNLTVTRMCGHICKSTTLIGSILLSYWYLTGYWLVITAMSTTLWLAA